MGKTKRRREAKAAAVRGKRIRIIGVVVGVLVVALASALLLPRLLATPPDTGDPDTYFSARKTALRKPHKLLMDNLVVGLNSWETPGPAAPPQIKVSPGVTGTASPAATATPKKSPSPSPRKSPSPSPSHPQMGFFVGLENKNESKSIVIADVSVVPSTATAPGARLEKSRFVETRVKPGQKIQVEIQSTVLKDAKRVPNKPQDQLASEDYGVTLSIVAAFEDEAPSDWRELRHPEDADGFKENWSAFAWLSSFKEIPPQVLFISVR